MLSSSSSVGMEQAGDEDDEDGGAPVALGYSGNDEFNLLWPGTFKCSKLNRNSILGRLVRPPKWIIKQLKQDGFVTARFCYQKGLLWWFAGLKTERAHPSSDTNREEEGRGGVVGEAGEEVGDECYGGRRHWR